MKFGYLPVMNLDTANLQSEDQLRDALRTLQVSYENEYIYLVLWTRTSRRISPVSKIL